MNMAMLFVIIAAFFVSLIFIIIILKATKTDGAIKCKFDERQSAVRGKAYQISFFVLLGYNVVYGIVTASVQKPFIEPFAAMVIGICLAVMVNVVYCILKDAYFSLNENRKSLLIVFSVLSVINLFAGVRAIMEGEAVKNGVITLSISNLVCAILLILILIALLIKHLQDKKAIS